MDKIKYTCKNCGWETSIREQWGDLKPKRCMNKRCNTSFLAQPDSLVVKRPEKSEPKYSTKSNKSYKHGNKNSKRKESGSSVEQQSTEGEASE